MVASAVTPEVTTAHGVPVHAGEQSCGAWDGSQACRCVEFHAVDGREGGVSCGDE